MPDYFDPSITQDCEMCPTIAIDLQGKLHEAEHLTTKQWDSGKFFPIDDADLCDWVVYGTNWIITDVSHEPVTLVAQMRPDKVKGFPTLHPKLIVLEDMQAIADQENWIERVRNVPVPHSSDEF